MGINNKGGEGKCLYIDTEKTFRPERVIPIAQRFNLEIEHVQEDIAIAPAHNTEEQMELLIEAAALMTQTR